MPLDIQSLIRTTCSEAQLIPNVYTILYMIILYLFKEFRIHLMLNYIFRLENRNIIGFSVIQIVQLIYLSSPPYPYPLSIYISSISLFIIHFQFVCILDTYILALLLSIIFSHSLFMFMFISLQREKFKKINK